MHQDTNVLLILSTPKKEILWKKDPLTLGFPHGGYNFEFHHENNGTAYDSSEACFRDTVEIWREELKSKDYNRPGHDTTCVLHNQSAL